MTPGTYLSCRKTKKKWYYIMLCFKQELRYDIIINFDGHLGGHFEFYSEVNRDHTHFFAMDFGNTFPILNSIPNL